MRADGFGAPQPQLTEVKRDGFEAKCWRRLDVRTPAAELDGSGQSVGLRKRMDPASPLVALFFVVEVERNRLHLLKLLIVSTSYSL